MFIWCNDSVLLNRLQIGHSRLTHSYLLSGDDSQSDLRVVGFVKRNALIYSIPATPPWLLKRPDINYNIHYFSKDNTSPEIYRNKFFEFSDHYKDFSQLYTDGSKMLVII